MSADTSLLEDLSARLSRNHTRRTIPWDALERDAHDSAHLKRVGRAWQWRAKQEHLAVGAFSMVTRELAEEGCDPLVLGLMARAASDEVRHAALCAEYARRLLDDRKAIHPRMQGVPAIPAHAESSPSVRVLLHVVEMCCFSETLTGAYFTELRGRATHPTARALVDSLLEDEIDHGRVGWAYLEQRAHDGTLDGLSEALPAIADRTVGVVIRSAREKPEPSVAAIEQLGHLGLNASAELYRGALEALIVPGLESAGVDTAPLRAWRA